jgi:hypothetical protein
MSLLITNIYSNIPKFIQRVKNNDNVRFETITDLSYDCKKKIRLNIRVKLNKIDNDCYKCTRPINNLISDYNSKNNLKNVLLGLQPTGCNPVLSDDSNKIYMLIKDFTILEDVILTKNKSQNLYITFCDIYNSCYINTVNADTFGTFELITGNPLFADVLQVETPCHFINRLIKSLMNKTVYIIIEVNADTKFILTDDTTNININNLRFNVTCNDYNYETPHFLLKNNIYMLACTISSNEISAYINNSMVCKKGEYYHYTKNNDISLQLANCIVHSVEINDNIHYDNKIYINIKNKFKC